MKQLLIAIVVLLIGSTVTVLEAQTVWSPQINPINNDTLLGKIQFVSSTEGWISASGGALLHTLDAGAHWSVVKPFPSDTVFSMADPSMTMSWVNQTHGWKMNWFGTSIGGARGAVIHKTTDGGSTWTKKVLSTAVGDMGFQVQFVDANNGWASIYQSATGNMSTVRSTDGGNNWSPVGTGGIFHFVDTNNGWAIGSPKIYRTTDGGTNWSPQYTDSSKISFNAIQFTDLNNGWVVGDSSRILKTTNGGTNWTLITNTGISAGSKSKCVFFLNASTGWIGTNIPSLQGDQRVILFTNNGGSSWTQQNPQNTGPVFSIFFMDANNGWFTGDQCVQNCSLPDSLRVSAGVIGHTTNGGVTGVGATKNSLPAGHSLAQNYPNPFNPTTIISYTLSQRSWVRITIIDLLGREVATLIGNEERSAGTYNIEWNAVSFVSGIYFYRLQAGGFVATKKLVLLK